MTSSHIDDQALSHFQEDFDKLRREVAKVVVGYPDVIDAVLTAAIAGGHVLVEGVPGLGKTVLVRTLSEVLDLSFSRIQFTPDLMPSDLLGTYVVMETPQGRRMFEFQKGPIFASLILADQINRGVPKTQSALLQAMEGDEINMAQQVFHLPQPFFVMATQNPLEMEGTFPLPEPQIDRFFYKIVVAAPSTNEIDAILERTTEGDAPETRSVVDGERLLEMRQVARTVWLDPALRRWIASVIAASHPDFPQASEMVRRYVRYGASPRGGQAMALGSKVLAAAAGRKEVTKDDLAAVAGPALRHRLLLNFEGQAENVAPDRLIESILESVGKA